MFYPRGSPEAFSSPACLPSLLPGRIGFRRLTGLPGGRAFQRHDCQAEASGRSIAYPDSAFPKALYTDYGRWLLAAAVFLGWGAGLLVALSEVMLAVLMAFLAGGVILNVLKEELPEERESRFWAFAFGAAGYAVILLLQ